MTAPKAILDFGADSSASTEVKLQVAPLVDIVLFLIFFYLVVGQMVMHQKDNSINLPTMAAEQAVTEEPAEVILNVRGDGSVVVDGRSVSSDELVALLTSERAKSDVAHQGLRVIVRADRQGRYEALNGVLAACRGCGLKQVVLRAKEGP